MADDGTFSVVASNGATISESLKDNDDSKSDDDFVTATVAGQTVTAARTPIFGPSEDIPGDSPARRGRRTAALST